MSFPAPVSFRDLCAFVFGDHSLKLNHELVLGPVSRRRLQIDNLNATSRKPFAQQDPIGVLTAEPVRASSSVPLRSVLALLNHEPLPTRSHQTGATIVSQLVADANEVPQSAKRVLVPDAPMSASSPRCSGIRSLLGQQMMHAGDRGRLKKTRWLLGDREIGYPRRF